MKVLRVEQLKKERQKERQRILEIIINAKSFALNMFQALSFTNYHMNLVIHY